MSRLGQNLGWGTATLLAAAVYLGLRQSGPTNNEPMQSGVGETLPPNVTLRLRNVTISGRANGNPAWNLHADLVDATRQQETVDFTGNVAAHFLQGGQERALVSAPKATYRVRAKQIQASGGIVCRVVGPPQNNLKDSDTLSIQTPEVLWDIGARQVSCPSQVKVTRGSAVVHGNNFSVDLVTREYSLHNFDATFQIGESNNPAEAFRFLSPASQTP